MKRYPVVISSSLSVYQGDKVDLILDAEDHQQALERGHKAGMRIFGGAEYSDIQVHVKLPLKEMN